MNLNYVIGAGLISITLPELTQTPDCGQKFTEISLIQVEQSFVVPEVEELIQFDEEFNIISISTNDKSLN